ncbi:MAG: beta-ribofuranosylaminobenzene 5'-phosphate synthase family protein [Burkholderiales bacterium]
MNRTKPSQRSVVVEAPARLHMGFLDFGRLGGRRFGGVGLTIDGLSTRIRAERATSNSAGAGYPRILPLLEILQRKFDLHTMDTNGGCVRIEVEKSIPEHVGLGSGTQMALAVGCAVARLFDLETSASTVAALLDRGRRSGIGIGAFDQGGFLVDGGSAIIGDSGVPPIVSRLAFPAHWRVLLVFDDSAQGLHGGEESGAFCALPLFPEASSARLCRLVLLRALPALQAANIEEFGAAITELQQAIGDYFAQAQGGRYASPRVAEALAWFAGRGASGIGQSSWGPTGFVIVESEDRAQVLLEAARAWWNGNGGNGRTALRFAVYQGRNRGGEIWVREARAQNAANYA